MPLSAIYFVAAFIPFFLFAFCIFLKYWGLIGVEAPCQFIPLGKKRAKIRRPAEEDVCDSRGNESRNPGQNGFFKAQELNLWWNGKIFRITCYPGDGKYFCDSLQLKKPVDDVVEFGKQQTLPVFAGGIVNQEGKKSKVDAQHSGLPASDEGHFADLGRVPDRGDRAASYREGGKNSQTFSVLKNMLSEQQSKGAAVKNPKTQRTGNADEKCGQKGWKGGDEAQNRFFESVLAWVFQNRRPRSALLVMEIIFSVVYCSCVWLSGISLQGESLLPTQRNFLLATAVQPASALVGLFWSLIARSLAMRMPAWHVARTVRGLWGYYWTPDVRAYTKEPGLFVYPSWLLYKAGRLLTVYLPVLIAIALWAGYLYPIFCARGISLVKALFSAVAIAWLWGYVLRSIKDIPWEAGNGFWVELLLPRTSLSIKV